MKTKIAIALLSCLLCSGAASAETYYFDGTVTLCTGSCDSFASLDVGSQISGQWIIETTADGTWTSADIQGFSATALNNAVPWEPDNGSNPTTANPLALTPAIAPVAAVGGGTTDGSNQLNSGTIAHEFVVPPFSSNGAWIIFDIGADGQATATVCLFYATTGCIPGATVMTIVDGTFTREGTVPAETSSWGTVKCLYR